MATTQQNIDTHKRTRRTMSSLCALFALAVSVPHASADVTDAMQSAWYVTEVIVFFRPAALEETTAEDFATHLPAAEDSFATEDSLARDATAAPMSNAAESRGAPSAVDVVTGEWVDPPAVRESDGVDLAALVSEAMSERAPHPDSADERAVAQLIEAFEALLEENAFTNLTGAYRELTGIADTLRRRRGNRVLTHVAWAQAIPERDAPQPVNIDGGLVFDDVPQLTGRIAVTRGRYLHLHADLAYTEPELGQRLVDHPIRAFGDVQPVIPLFERRYALIDERRRMRPGELHYFDHPKFGMLAQIRLLEPPDALAAAYDALERVDD